MNKRLVVKQNGYKDCAVACLVSIMRYYDVYPLYEEVSYLLKVGRDGTNAFNIINGAREMGFDGYGVHYSIDELFNCEVRFPIICHTINSGYYHFEVLYGKKKNKFIVMDPSLGIKYISKSDFEKYLSLTPYGNMPFEEGWQTYFSCFYLFNAIMKPMPVLRYKIITKLIPAFMKYRKKQLAKEKKQ